MPVVTRPGLACSSDLVNQGKLLWKGAHESILYQHTSLFLRGELGEANA